MTDQDLQLRMRDVNRGRARDERRERRRQRRERIIDLAGSFAGEMFGTKKVGWLAVAVAAIAGAIVLMRML